MGPDDQRGGHEYRIAPTLLAPEPLSLERSAPNAATLTRLVRVCTYGSLLAIERGRGFENLVLDGVPGALPISGTVPGDPRDNCAAQDEEPGQTSW